MTNLFRIPKAIALLGFRAMVIGLLIAATSHLGNDVVNTDPEWAAYCAAEGQDDFECREDQEWVDYCASDGSDDPECHLDELPRSVDRLRMLLHFLYHTAEFIICSAGAFLAGVWSAFRPIRW